YFYNGIQRIQLFFHSPNTCAVFINFIIIALIVFFNYYHYHNNDNNKKNIIRYSSVLMILGFMTLSASTFSRGGTIALIVSLLLYSWFTRKSSSLWFICIFIIINILFPEGSARLNSIFQISGDKSIIHRFLIWEGTAGTLLEHPWIGVGLANVGRYYSAWHQPLELHERYHSAIGDLSTIGSAYGFLILFLTCYSICFIFTYIVFSKKNLSLRNVEIVGAAVTFFATIWLLLYSVLYSLNRFCCYLLYFLYCVHSYLHIWITN
ncbi:MAG: O-antigen ligase family protein, partial [Victivallales bacterium]|nr:O-antigen ligase family protein [Victivallales bacterium]